MKKLLSLALALLLALSALALFTACSSSSSQDQPASTPGPSQTPDPGAAHKDAKENKNTSGEASSSMRHSTIEITSEDCFADSGYYIFTVGADASLRVKIAGSERDVEWKVYVLDDKYTDDIAAFSEGREPALTSDGSLNVKKGEYVYVYCSVNALTADAPAEGAVISFTGPGLPKK